MTQRSSFAVPIAITISRVFGKMGLTLGLLLGALGILQPVAAQPIPLGGAVLLTPAAVGGNLEPATSEGFTKVEFRGHRGFRRGFSKGGHGFRDRRFGGHGFGKRRFFGHGFGKRRFFDPGFRGHRFGGPGFRNRHSFRHRFGGNGFGKHGFKRSY